MTMQGETTDQAEELDPADQIPLASGNVAGTPDVTGQPGVETALGRDRSQGELPPELATNRLTDTEGGPGTAGSDRA